MSIDNLSSGTIQVPSRRLFLKGLLVAGASAPAIVNAASLMKLAVPKPATFKWSGTTTGRILIMHSDVYEDCLLGDLDENGDRIVYDNPNEPLFKGRIVRIDDCIQFVSDPYNPLRSRGLLPPSDQQTINRFLRLRQESRKHVRFLYATELDHP